MKARYDFASDNVAGAAPEALQAIVDHNAGPASGYGTDHVTARAADLVRRIRAEARPSLMEHFLSEYGLSTREGADLRKIQAIATISEKPRVIPMRGESAINEIVPGHPFGQLVQSNTPKPALDMAAPA